MEKSVLAITQAAILFGTEDIEQNVEEHADAFRLIVACQERILLPLWARKRRDCSTRYSQIRSDKLIFVSMPLLDAR